MNDPERNFSGTLCTDGDEHFCEKCGLPAARDVYPDCGVIRMCKSCRVPGSIPITEWWVWSDGTPRELFGKAKEIHGKV
jgi:hypothetical protein